jgi:hypothetical protein
LFIHSLFSQSCTDLPSLHRIDCGSISNFLKHIASRTHLKSQPFICNRTPFF